MGSLHPVDGGITAAIGPVGKKAKRSASGEPEGELDLDCSMDGATNMERGK